MARPYIPHLDINAMPWASPAPGIQARMLSRDPDTGARTALNRIVPSQGYKNQPTAHYHRTTEEILVVKGMMSFDSQTWLTPVSYVYHPSEYVHGFKSSVPVESWFISRVGRDLDFNYVPEPAALSPYFVGETKPTRGLAQVPDALSGQWEVRDAMRWRILSLDPVSGQGSLLLRLHAGAALDSSAESAERELALLDGALSGDDGTGFAAFSYACWPEDRRQPRLSSADGALIYIHYNRGLDGLISRLG
jgi:hypothetical protein